MIRNYYLGCPIWANKDWVGEFFSPNAKPHNFLKQYATVLNTVEGNNTFYGLPKPKTIERWREDTPPAFRFSFKFPQSISHEQKLLNVKEQVAQFLSVMAPLAERIGIFFLQLPPTFSSHHLPQLETFLASLPRDFSYAVEVRHPDFFDHGDHEQRFNDLLRRYNVNRAMFDTVVLHDIKSHDPFVVAAQRRKPKMPARLIATGQHPFLRFVGYNEVAPNIPHLTTLAGTLAEWINKGLQPFVFFHSPNDFYAPHLCRMFHQILSQRIGEKIVGDMPKWPVEDNKTGEQLSLF